MKKYQLIPIIILFSDFIFGQIVYQPLNDQVYNYLSILSRKGITNFEDLMKPVSRKYIAKKLLEADEKKNELTDLEKEELEYYKKDFYGAESFKKENEEKQNLSFLEKMEEGD
jgi:hypothetical protein